MEHTLEGLRLHKHTAGHFADVLGIYIQRPGMSPESVDRMVIIARMAATAALRFIDLSAYINTSREDGGHPFNVRFHDECPSSCPYAGGEGY